MRKAFYLGVLAKGHERDARASRGDARASLMRKALFLSVLWLWPFLIWANEIPKVPSTIEFAGMKLKLNEAARLEIQRDVDALHASRKYFDIKLDRVNLYFPIIERIFKEENLPDDFKYLVIQESALISDAVSSSNAVGFWQFKDFTGREVGLRIDKLVDERLNIVAASRGAAKYLSRHNFYFNNWVYSLLAYNTGRGGAQRFVNKDLFGVTTMPIDQHTHWYVKKFLAHKIAFEKEIGGHHSEGLRLHEYTEGNGKSLEIIAKEFDADLAMVNQYNKWILSGPVPTDKEYVVIVPMTHKIKETSSKPIATDTKPSKSPTSSSKTYPSIGENLDGKVNKLIVKLNGLQAIMAQDGDNFASLAEKAGLSVKQLAKINEVTPQQKVTPGDFYYIKSKRAKGSLYYYTVGQGESLWSISQKFGIKVANLAKNNRMAITDVPERSRVLWLRKRRPVDVPIEYFHEKGLSNKPEPIMKEAANNAKPIIKEATPSTPITETKTVSQKEPQPKPAVMAPADPIVETKIENTKPIVVKEEQKKEAASPKKATVTHTVQPGETLSAISRKYSVPLADLRRWNNLDTDIIKPGQELKMEEIIQNTTLLPSQNSSTDKITFHEVMPGETLYGISRLYNIPIDKLMLLNNRTNYNISVGEKIKVVE